MARAAALALLLVLACAATAHAQGGADKFRLPSGNIDCAYEHYSFSPKNLRCEIRTKIKPTPPSGCADGYIMHQTGPARPFCASDTIYDRNALVLAYGTTRQFGVFKCTSSAAGLRCANASGNGFVMSTPALVHAQGSRAAVRRVQDTLREHRLRVLDRARRHRVDGMRDQERPEATPAADPLRRRRPERQARLATRHRPRRAGPLRRRSGAAAPADRRRRQGARIREDRPLRRDQLRLHDHGPDVPEPQRPRLLSQPRALADVLTQVLTARQYSTETR